MSVWKVGERVVFECQVWELSECVAEMGVRCTIFTCSSNETDVLKSLSVLPKSTSNTLSKLERHVKLVCPFHCILLASCDVLNCMVVCTCQGCYFWFVNLFLLHQFLVHKYILFSMRRYHFVLCLQTHPWPVFPKLICGPENSNTIPKYTFFKTNRHKWNLPNAIQLNHSIVRR